MRAPIGKKQPSKPQPMTKQPVGTFIAKDQEQKKEQIKTVSETQGLKAPNAADRLKKILFNRRTKSKKS